ncbi:MAG: TetR/AcrR family transcriptional regulator, partial [Pseudomonadales bacterium]|nr:TetR/AcrR family transcriptional regulator [Pseudomonadales bacterium]
MARVKKEDWINEATRLLIEGGFAKLTLENLLERLGVTHGSFYHHFRNRQALTEAVLKQWRKEMTQDVLASASQIGDINERAEALIKIGQSFTDQTQLEIAFRSQARVDPMVREYVQEVDELRIQNCVQLAKQLFGDTPRAQVIGKLAHAVFVGSQQMIPAYTEKETEA